MPMSARAARADAAVTETPVPMARAASTERTEPRAEPAAPAALVPEEMLGSRPRQAAVTSPFPLSMSNRSARAVLAASEEMVGPEAAVTEEPAAMAARAALEARAAPGTAALSTRAR